MTYQVQRRTDHVKLGLSRLVSVPRGKPRVRGTLAPYLRQVQKLESAAYEVADYLNIENGFGVILDMIGRLVGCGRNGRSDDDYKIALRVKIRINKSLGKRKDFLDVGAMALPGTTWHVANIPPAAVLVWSDQPMPSLSAAETMIQYFGEVRALGVGAYFDLTFVPEEEQMLNGWRPTDVTSGDGHGMAWQGDDVGGKMSYMVSV